MSVRIASDLVVSVMQAANPARAQAAAAKLSGLTGATAAPTPAFASLFAETASAPQKARDLPGDLIMDVMNAADSSRLAAASARLGATVQHGTRVAAEQHAPHDSYAKFEGFLLRSAFEDILPPADSGAFGDGFAGGVWRSMAAEQFANLFADRGGIGIADMLRRRAEAGQTASNAPVAGGQWPYFEMPKLSPLA